MEHDISSEAQRKKWGKIDISGNRKITRQQGGINPVTGSLEAKPTQEMRLGNRS